MTTAAVITTAIARNVAELRTRAGLSQHALSAKLGLSPAAAQHIERGRRNTTLPMLVALAAALGVQPVQLVTSPACRRCWDIPRPGATCPTCNRSVT